MALWDIAHLPARRRCARSGRALQ